MKKWLAVVLTVIGISLVLCLPPRQAIRSHTTAAVLLRHDEHQQTTPSDAASSTNQAEARPEADQTDTNRIEILGELPAQRASAPAAQADFPAVAVTSDGAVWIAYLQWNRGDTDSIIVRRQAPGGQWGEPVELVDGCFEHYIPALAARGTSVLAAWSGHNDQGFDVYAAEVSADGTPSQTRRLTTAVHTDMNVRCASDSEGNVSVVWQSFRNQQSDIYLRRLSDDKWSDEFRVSLSQANDWEPALAIDSHGTAWISWDSYDHGNYDILIRSFDGEALGRTIPVTTEATAQFHSTITIDREDRIWVAWDDAGINWGKDFSRSSAVEGSRGLHHSRSIGIRVIEEGQLRTPTADLSEALKGPMSRYAELPHLATDRQGTLWMVFRHWTFKRPHEMFHFYATRLNADGWSTPYRLDHSAGRNSQHAGLAEGRDGRLRVVYASDGRAPDVRAESVVEAMSYIVYIATLPSDDAPGTRRSADNVEFVDIDLPSPAAAPPRRPRHKHVVNGKELTLMFGDCHRHTDIRGHSGVDGSALDTYRYALDAAQLDFLGLGDHNQVTGGQWPDALRDYQWWYQQKFVDLFTCLPTFIGIYSYEHSLGQPAGHRNILHLRRGAPMRVANRLGGRLLNPDNQPPNLWKWINENVLTQPGQRVVIVPHTFGAGPLADWNWINADFDCLLEIYQGARGSYEAWRLPAGEKRGPTQTDEPGHFARDALDKENIYGFVSFSDHGSTHNSWAGVWVEQENRASLFDAMLAKRTFGASDEMVMRVTAEDSAAEEFPVGSHLVADIDAPLKIKIDIEAPDQILRVDVIKDGNYVYTTYPNRNRFNFTFHDRDTEPGDAYYYVRAIQRDPEAPRGDPEIGWASPFFVTYN